MPAEQPIDSVEREDRFLEALPAIYREDPFLSRFLAPFQRVLLGGGNDDDDAARGFEETIDRLHELFDPQRTPERLLPWLACWVGLDLPEALDIRRQRCLVAEAVDLRRQRGTREGLERMLELTTGGRATVTEPSAPDLQIGVHSTVGVDTYVETPPLGRFHVDLSVPADVDETEVEAIARQFIESEKPAHTQYTLTVSASEGMPASDARAVHEPRLDE